RRMENLRWKLRISDRDIDGSPFRNWPRPMPDTIIGPKRRSDRPGEPIKANICEKPVAREGSLDLATAIRPSTELLDDPGGESCGRVGKRKGERLRLCPLYPLVAGLFSEPSRAGFEIGLFFGGGVANRPRITSNGQQVDMDAGQFLGMR